MRQLFHRLFIFGLAGLVHFGCSGDDKNNGDETGDGDFISTNPSRPGGRSVDDGAGAPSGATGSGGTGGLAGAPGGENDGGDPARAIEEADIIQKSGNRLYALSQYGGLSAIDIGTRDELKLLGRYKTDATPFEMYLRDGDVVLGLFNSYGTYLYDEEADTYTWIQSSRVVALDVSDPANIEELASFPIPGSISDSRIVGDVLYVIGYEDSGCWGCGASPATTILSLDISNPLEVKKVDTLRYEDEQTDYGWMRRSVTATDERLYVAGVEYSTNGSLGSTIHVIDISDPNGAIAEVDQAEAEGQITSRWQMDEYDGVLRVISQPPDWDLTKPPVVQTWSIGQQNALTPLGRTTLTLPRPEQLQSVRFDGPRGYAITFERTDPLFTIDLSDPAKPVQKGELEMPGFLYHMEPRGDRLVGLGFDQGNSEGSLTVSLFDVSDLSAPTMLDRVNFGGDWASLAEDQDRIHKSFNILDEIGTILVPYSGWDHDANGWCGRYQSGVQIIDYAAQKDALTLRGAAKSRGQARRGILHDERLLTVSDDRVQSFDIDDRDAPAETASVTLTTNVVKSAIVGDHVVRLTNDWWTSSPRLEVVSLADAENPVAVGELDLGEHVDTQRSSCYSWSYPRELFANETYAYLVYDTYAYYYDGDFGKNENTAGVVVVDVSNPKKPSFVAKHTITRSGYPGSYYGYAYGLASSGKDVVQVGSTLALLSTNSECANPDCTRTNTQSFIDVVDLSDPSSPRSTALRAPVGLGNTGLVTSGNIIAMSHYAAADSEGTRVRFFLDRVDVSNPAAPAWLAPKNIPGSLLAYDAAKNGVLTVDYQAVTERFADDDDCYAKYGYSAEFVYDERNEYTGPGTCYAIQQSLKLVRFSSGAPIVQGTYELAASQYVGSAATGNDRTFITQQNLRYYYGGVYDGYGYGWGVVQDVEMPVIVVAGLRSGNFAAGEISVQGGDYWSVSALQASGTRAILSTGWRGELTVVDGADAASPAVVKEVAIQGYVSDLDVAGNLAVVSLGMDGVQVVELE